MLYSYHKLLIFFSFPVTISNFGSDHKFGSPQKIRHATHSSYFLSKDMKKNILFISEPKFFPHLQTYVRADIKFRYNVSPSPPICRGEKWKQFGIDYPTSCLLQLFSCYINYFLPLFKKKKYIPRVAFRFPSIFLG